MRLEQRLLKHIRDLALIRPGDTVLVGVSGGADSVALLNLLYRLRHELGIQLHVAHFNHRWRDAADGDEEFVRRQTESLGLSCTVGRAATRASKSDKGSLEEKAREARLIFYRKTAAKTKADKVALAHTKDDLAETVLMRIIRGTGLKGLLAIAPETPMDGMTLIRPLLDIPKKELLAYLENHGIDFREDATNEDPDFLRNRIRHRLLPLLRKCFNPQIDDVLIRLNDSAGLDYLYIQDQTEEFFHRACTVHSKEKSIRMNVDEYLSGHPALRRMLLRHIYSVLKGNTRQLTWDHVLEVEQALQQGGKSPAVTWPGAITIKRGRGHVTFAAGNST